jgi:pimeloyl-ACP methyl ester carboxylesterase
MLRTALSVVALLGVNPPQSAGPQPFPDSFHVEDVYVGEVTLHVRIGGRGPAVVLLHGYAETGDMWAPLAANLVLDHTVIVPDLRGLGLSSRPPDGYDKQTEAEDILRLLDRLDIPSADVVGHDIGDMVAFAMAAKAPQRVTRLVVMDAPLPGVGAWSEIVRNRALWHFSFYGPDAERLVTGRERIYLDRFWNEFAANPGAIDEATRAHYARLYALPGAMRAGFAQFAAFAQDARDNQAFVAKERLDMPVLAIGGDHSFGAGMAEVMRAAADHVTGVVIADAGHWLIEEQPAATIAAIRDFLSFRS